MSSIPAHDPSTKRCSADVSPNKSLQRAAFGIKCSAAGGRASRAMHPRRARVLTRQPAVAELNRYTALLAKRGDANQEGKRCA
jgi:hypothetical protein